MIFECSRGKTHQAARELVFGVNNPAVFLRKILGLFSMAKRQNSSRQPDVFSHSALKYHNHRVYLFLLTNSLNKINPRIINPPTIHFTVGIS